MCYICCVHDLSVSCSLQVGGELLPQVEEFKYHGVLFTSEGRIACEIDRRIGAAAAELCHPGGARSRAAAPPH